MKRTIALLALAAVPTQAAAQDLDNRSSENYERVWFVPRLAGALSLEGGLVQPLRLGTPSGYPTTWFAGAGWKHYFEGHGRTQLRLMLTYEHGGVLNPKVEGTANRIGLSTAFTLRGISQEWYFGQLSALAEASLITLRPAANPLTGDRAEFDVGFEVGGGLETTFGSMFVLDPYLMAETGANFTVSYVDIAGVDTFEIWGRFVVRFDYGFRTFDEEGQWEITPAPPSPDHSP